MRLWRRRRTNSRAKFKRAGWRPLPNLVKQSTASDADGGRNLNFGDSRFVEGSDSNCVSARTGERSSRLLKTMQVSRRTTGDVMRVSASSIAPINRASSGSFVENCDERRRVDENYCPHRSSISSFVTSRRIWPRHRGRLFRELPSASRPAAACRARASVPRASAWAMASVMLVLRRRASSARELADLGVADANAHGAAPYIQVIDHQYIRRRRRRQ